MKNNINLRDLGWRICLYFAMFKFLAYAILFLNIFIRNLYRIQFDSGKLMVSSFAIKLLPYCILSVFQFWQLKKGNNKWYFIFVLAEFALYLVSRFFGYYNNIVELFFIPVLFLTLIPR